MYKCGPLSNRFFRINPRGATSELQRVEPVDIQCILPESTDCLHLTGHLRTSWVACFRAGTLSLRLMGPGIQESARLDGEKLASLFSLTCPQTLLQWQICHVGPGSPHFRTRPAPSWSQALAAGLVAAGPGQAVAHGAAPARGKDVRGVSLVTCL